MLHLDQQVQPLLKWIQGRTKSPANTINALTRVELADTILQDCQDLLRTPLLSPKSPWKLQRQGIPPCTCTNRYIRYPSGFWGGSKPPPILSNKSQVSTSQKPPSRTSDSSLRPFIFSHKRLAPAVGKGFHTVTGPTGTAVPLVAPGADQSPHQQNQRT